jgi:hypothetical protein
MVLLCFTGDAPCLNVATNAAAKVAGPGESRTTQTAISQKSWGKVLPARSYTVIIVPPRL